MPIGKYKVYIFDVPNLFAFTFIPNIIIFSKAFKEKLSEEEFIAVLYHEMAHLEKGHFIITSISLLLFLAFSYAIYLSNMSSKLIALILFILVAKIIYFIASVIIETQADFHACENGFKNEIISVLNRFKGKVDFEAELMLSIRLFLIKLLS